MPRRQVHIDADGNVIILAEEDGECGRMSRHDHSADEQAPDLAFQSPSTEPGVFFTPEEPEEVLNLWTIVETDTVEPAPALKPDHASIAQIEKAAPVIRKHLPVGQVLGSTRAMMKSSIAEGRSQYASAGMSLKLSLIAALRSLGHLPASSAAALRRAWIVATEPYSLATLGWSRARPHSRASLFALDTVRFGGTFALIFVTLFVTVNYQSFWQIAKAQLALSDDLQTEQALSDITSHHGADVLLGNGNSIDAQKDLVAYLPDVGPYENRLIIPELSLNVPIVKPPIQALIDEDWKKFEDDVQGSLQRGVVHYPGSANPGQAGNFFITGHSSYYPWDPGQYKDVFARLHNLSPGDTYSVYYGGDLHLYKITEKKEVKPTDVSVLDQPTDRRIATLMTCTPVGTALRRLIIVAEEIDPATGEVLRVGQHGTENSKPLKLESLPI